MVELVIEIARIVLPIIILGGIGILVVYRLKRKYEQGTLGKKKTKGAQQLLDSLIPFGPLIGLVVATLVSIFTEFPLLSAIPWGSGIGMLFGYIAYEIYSKAEESH